MPWALADIPMLVTLDQARLQDLGAPVQLVKWDLNFCANSITSKTKSYVYFII
jgi:hypothetical protein